MIFTNNESHILLILHHKICGHTSVGKTPTDYANYTKQDISI